jgi:hypothetical protein
MGVLLAETGHKQALASAIAEARSEELKRLAEDLGQLDLFGPAEPRAAQSIAVNGHRGAGRPQGARNKRTDEAARFYMSRFGDPLARGVEIAAIPILAPGVLPELAKVLGMERADAAKWWAGVYASTLPYIRQRLATLTVKPEGSPDGEPVPLPWSYSYAEDEVLEHLELTHNTPAQGQDEP